MGRHSTRFRTKKAIAEVRRIETKIRTQIGFLRSSGIIQVISDENYDLGIELAIRHNTKKESDATYYLAWLGNTTRDGALGSNVSL